MPTMSATACSIIKWMVVHDVPRPRARAASMKLQVAGRMFPNTDALTMAGRLSSRGPSLQQITNVGHLAMFWDR